MTKTVEEIRRQLFEHEYIQYRVYLKRNKDGSYNEEWVESRWQGFNAALDLVEIELPKGNSSMTTGALHMISCCRKSIESLNLGIKIK